MSTDASLRSRLRPSREGGFSFVEILVVMGIIAVLAGIGIMVMNIAAGKTPEFKTRALLQRVSGTAEHWKSKIGAYPPADATKIGLISGSSFTVAKLPNLTNGGIESLYLSLQMPGYGRAIDLSDKELSNTDEDFLDKPFLSTLSKDLWEAKDDWGNPLVYFSSPDYMAAEKDPPTYYTESADAPEVQVRPKPWRSTKTNAFEQARSFQLFSMGADGVPNTDDDLKAWTLDKPE